MSCPCCRLMRVMIGTAMPMARLVAGPVAKRSMGGELGGCVERSAR